SRPTCRKENLGNRTSKSGSPRRLFAPKLEVLEERCVPSAPEGTLQHNLTINSDGTIHDAATGMNWLADANLAATINPDGSPKDGITFNLPINPDGSMTWETAMNWVDDLNHFDNGDGKPKGSLFHTDWTLPPTPDGSRHAASLFNDRTQLSYGFDF